MFCATLIFTFVLLSWLGSRLIDVIASTAGMTVKYKQKY